MRISSSGSNSANVDAVSLLEKLRQAQQAAAESADNDAQDVASGASGANTVSNQSLDTEARIAAARSQVLGLQSPAVRGDAKKAYADANSLADNASATQLVGQQNALAASTVAMLRSHDAIANVRDRVRELLLDPEA